MSVFQDEDLSDLTKIGAALWLDSKEVEEQLVETLSAVSLLKISSDEAIIRASQILLRKSKSQGVFQPALKKPDLFFNPFFRLSGSERLALVAVHLGKWSYRRTSQILDISSDQLESLLWQARLSWVDQSIYPAAPSPVGSACPEYDPRRPWSQRFLDQEFSQRKESFFLTRHILGCRACAQCVASARVLYQRVDQELRKALGKFSWKNQLDLDSEEAFLGSTVGLHSEVVKNLKLTLAQNPSVPPSYEGKFLSSWLTVLRSFDVQIVLLIVFILLAFQFFR
ncbi:MAG: hypothetical protein ACO3A2_08235 [Bdellovibrionia bacterium]